MPRLLLRPLRRSVLLRVACHIAAVLVPAVAVQRASADELSGLRSELLEETAHEVEVTLDRGFATLRVRRTVYNGGERHDQATFWLSLAPEMVATGLRTLGREAGRPRWFAGELLEAELAAARYRELTGIGGAYPKDPALLSWRARGELALQVFPCPPQEKKTVEYTLMAPTEYRGGAHHLVLPALGTSGLPPRLTVRAAQAGDRILAGTRRLVPGETITARPDLDLSLMPRSARKLAGRLAQVPVGESRVLTRFEVDAPPRFSQEPRGARVVLLVDGSASFAQGRSAALAALGAALGHFETAGALVQTLVFDRSVRALHPGFVSARAARQGLAQLEDLPRRNGSHVDRALYEAARLLAAAPPGAARRILLVTDGLAREGVTAERLSAAAQPSQAVLHIATVAEGAPYLQPFNGHDWAPAARRTGGLLWSASAPARGAGESQPELGSVFEEWVRPRRLHELALHASDFAADAVELEASELLEGEGIAGLALGPRLAPSYVLTGELWATPVRLLLEPDAAHDKLWSALVFGAELLEELSEEEMMILALQGGAVSPVTSYLAIEPGVRPSTEGLEGPLGLIGFGVLRGATCHGVRASQRRVDGQAYLKEAVGTLWESCGGAAGAGRVRVEVTRDEIVSVRPYLARDTPPAQRRCLHDGVWELLLPGVLADPWNAWTIRI